MSDVPRRDVYIIEKTPDCRACMPSDAHSYFYVSSSNCSRCMPPSISLGHRDDKGSARCRSGLSGGMFRAGWTTKYQHTKVSDGIAPSMYIVVVPPPPKAISNRPSPLRTGARFVTRSCCTLDWLFVEIALAALLSSPSWNGWVTACLLFVCIAGIWVSQDL